MREETRCRHIGYSFRLTARVLLYAPSHRQDNTYHSLCYTSRGALAETRNSSMGPPWRIDPTTHCTMSEHSYHGATSRSIKMKDLRLTAIEYWATADPIYWLKKKIRESYRVDKHGGIWSVCSRLVPVEVDSYRVSLATLHTGWWGHQGVAGT